MFRSQVYKDQTSILVIVTVGKYWRYAIVNREDVDWSVSDITDIYPGKIMKFFQKKKKKQDPKGKAILAHLDSNIKWSDVTFLDDDIEKSAEIENIFRFLQKNYNDV